MNTPTQPSEASNEPLSGLMERIVARHHVFCKREAPRLSGLFKEAVARHGKEHPELKRMEAMFAAMARELQMHLVKEEQTLFPYIARVEEAVRQQAPVSWPAFGTVENPIRMMVLEHDQTGGQLGEIRRLSLGYVLPPDAPVALTALYDALRSFETDMIEHVRAEDEHLFPRAVAMEAEACARRKPAAG